MQAIEYVKKIKMFASIRIEKVKKGGELDVKKGIVENIKVVKITNLNKNIMSILLPYLSHHEILRFEACSK